MLPPFSGRGFESSFLEEERMFTEATVTKLDKSHLSFALSYYSIHSRVNMLHESGYKTKMVKDMI